MAVYATGNSVDGQLGIPGEENKLTFVKLPHFGDTNIKTIKAGNRHCILITNGGTTYSWGDNQRGQLGRSSQRNRIPNRIDSLETMTIIAGDCGGDFTVLLSKEGIITFGGNIKGELGQGDRTEEGRVKPKSIKSKFSRYVDVSCGLNFALALSEGGEVIGWGENWMGQLGYGDFVNHCSPQPQIPTIFGYPVTMIACGDSHSLMLTVSGEVFSFGSNQFGELGLGDNVDQKYRPNLIKFFQRKQIIKICCGSFHSMALSSSGVLYTWGSNSIGQLGHGDTKHQYTPKVVQHFNDFRVEDIAAGSRHSLALVQLRENDKKSRALYSWGQGGSGQLGLGDNGNRITPTRIRSFENAPSITQLLCGGEFTMIVTENEEEDTDLSLRNSYGSSASFGSPLSFGGSLVTSLGVPSLSFGSPKFSFLNTSTSSDLSVSPSSFGSPKLESYFNSHFKSRNQKNLKSVKYSILHLTLDSVKKLVDTNNITKLQSKIKRVFGAPGSLNSSFLDNNNSSSNHTLLSDLVHGVDLIQVRMTFKILLELYETYPEVMNTLANSTGKLVKELPNINFKFHDSPSSLRLFLIILEIPWMMQPEKYHIVIEQLCSTLYGLPDKCKATLLSWLSHYRSEFFTRVVDVFSRYLSFLITNGGLEKQVSTAVFVLDMIYRANESGNQVIPYTKFYNHEVSESTDLRQSFIHWKSSARVFSFCRYPFLLNPEAKSKILGIDATHQMNRYAILAVCKLSDPYFTMRLRRNYLIEDTLHHLVSATQDDVRKPIRIVFEGEQAVDQGGVAKEFFYLAIEGLLDPNYGLFVRLQSNFNWFNRNYQYDDSAKLYRLVGVLLGMAIYNGVLLPVHFPIVVYRKLLNEKLTMEDFMACEPEMYKSFQQLKKMNNVEDLNLTFEMMYTNNFSNQQCSHELINGGKDIPVTDVNKDQFIDLYIDHYLTLSIETQFNAFKEGFFFICSEEILTILRAEELDLLLCGSNELDFYELEKSTEYFNGYNKDSLVIKYFWEIVHELPLSLKKKFLFFATGSDRAPISGLSRLQFKIQRSGPHSENLPVAHTCFHLIDLPEYNNKEVLREKLLISIQNCQGFGLV